MSRVADIPIGGRLEVRVRKRRLWCDNGTCARVTFTQTTDQIGLRARVTTRLAGRAVDALGAEARSVTAVAAQVGLSWRTVVRLVAATVSAVHDPDSVLVRRLGVDEHRFRRMRFVKLPDGPTVKIDPWMLSCLSMGGVRLVDPVMVCRCSPRSRSFIRWGAPP